MISRQVMGRVTEQVTGREGQTGIPASKAEESGNYREPMTDSAWRLALNGIEAWLAALPASEREHARQIASNIKERIEWLDAPMSAYCFATCPQCEDPCCNGRRVFYNQSDLIYLSALGDKIPPGQTRRHATQACRYLSPRGCLVPRPYRPYVCVWFLCEPQLEMLRQERVSFERRFVAVLQEIRDLRLQLEAWFEF